MNTGIGKYVLSLTALSSLIAGCDPLTTSDTPPEIRGSLPPEEEVGSEGTGADGGTSGGGLEGEGTDDAGGDPGCTLTQGFWKTHNRYGVAKQDPWPIDEDTELCGQTWTDLLQTPPRGDAWLILVHQWIAATLNVASGADASAEVAAALSEGEALLLTCAATGDDRATAVQLSELLDSFNNGGEGVPHCGDANEDDETGEDEGGALDGTGGGEGEPGDGTDDGEPAEGGEPEEEGGEPECEPQTEGGFICDDDVPPKPVP